MDRFQNKGQGIYEFGSHMLGESAPEVDEARGNREAVLAAVSTLEARLQEGGAKS